MTGYPNIVLFLATGFFLGRMPFAPGTFGTLAGIPLALVLTVLPVSFHLFYCLGIILAAVAVTNRAARILGEKDPGCIVIDEMVGYTVALSLVPVQVSTLAAGFVLFRCFDIFKPWPVRYFENNCPGGAGIVLDDVMAGFWAAVVLKILYSAGVL